MNFTADKIDRMSIAQFHAAIQGYLKANTAGNAEDSDNLTEQEYIRVLSEEKMAGRA
jgi:predicted transcriptional regulator